jgi:hypothetical protein
MFMPEASSSQTRLYDMQPHPAYIWLQKCTKEKKSSATLMLMGATLMLKISFLQYTPA